MRIELLSGWFRYGTPVLLVLCFAGLAPWWAVLIPVVPVWWSFMATTHRAHVQARVIRRPARDVSLAEAAAERRYLSADAILLQAGEDRAEAIRELASARAEATRARQGQSSQLGGR